MDEEARTSLTGLVKAGGCGSKFGPGDLREALAGLPQQIHSNFVFGSGHGDDAGVYKLRDDLAIVQTVDFFTPIVDDPFDFGAIAAANALSDCFVLGAQPVTALNLVTYPKNYGMDVLHNILRGGAEKVNEAGAVIVGGHTIQDPEPKYGLAVTGIVDPKKVITNDAAKPGNILILTKKIGTGIVSNLCKTKGLSDPILAAAYKEAVESMKTLNKTAAEVMVHFGVTAATDVTGFGLLGHALNVATASKTGLRLNFEKIPVFPGIKDFAKEGGGGACKRNAGWVAPNVSFADDVHFAARDVICDAQTSGPFLIAVPAEKAEACVQELRNRGVVNAAIIGEVTTDKPGTVRITN